MIIMMIGLPASGKSTVARRLAARLPSSVILDKDVIRAALFPPPEMTYSTEQDDFCMQVMLETAEYLLRRDPSKVVILDGRTFSRRYQRDRVRAFAARLETRLEIVECVCSDEAARRRLENDVATGRHVAQNRTVDLYWAVKDRFEPIQGPKLVLSTDSDLDQCVQAALAYLGE
ncbi:MAG: ATP-binding protein [Anaerolineae bacterium]|nr:ATP-binding protein [Anaerolineae bacterium]